MGKCPFNSFWVGVQLMRYSSVETFFFPMPAGPVTIRLTILQERFQKGSIIPAASRLPRPRRPFALLLPGVLCSGSDRDRQGVVNKGRENHSVNRSWRQENGEVKALDARRRVKGVHWGGDGGETLDASRQVSNYSR